jgi:hypothetical protein
MQCPDCKAEIEDGAEVCPRCFSVLKAPDPEPLDLWGESDRLSQPEVSKPEILTSAQRTADIGPAEVKAAVARAHAQRRVTGPTPQVPPAPAAAPPPPPPGVARPRPPTGPMPRTRRPTGRSSALTGPHPRIPPEAPAQAVFTGPVQQPPEAAPEGGGRRFGPQAQISTQLVGGDPEASRGTQIVEISLPPMVKQAVRRLAEEPDAAASLSAPESQVSRGLDQEMAAVRLLYLRMQRLDRWTLWVLLVALVGCFLPWMQVRGEGLLAGIQDLLGLGGLGLALLAVTCLLLRTARRRFTGVLLLAQLLVVAALAGTPVFRAITASEVQLSAGLFITAAAGGAGVLLTLLRMTRPGA